ncbi:MAG: hypothetical protein IJE99_06240 [Alistipes sp.]|nr:hypothetical protein [Alistipes sp.]
MYNKLKIKKMQNNYQEIIDLVAKKCQEVLAPLYAELEELQAHYGMREAEQQPTEPTPDPEEVRQAEFKKQLAEIKQMLIKSGRIPKDEANN